MTNDKFWYGFIAYIIAVYMAIISIFAGLLAYNGEGYHETNQANGVVTVDMIDTVKEATKTEEG